MHVTRLFSIGLAALAIAACGGANRASTTPNTQPKDAHANPCDGADADARCAHPLDRLLLARLAGIGVAPREAPANEVCRRMSLDLLGRIPTEKELDDCVKERPADRVEAFMALPEYVWNMRRIWGELVNYRSEPMWYVQTLELDGLVKSLYQGELPYDEFATRFVMHPAFFSRHQGDDWFSAMYPIFVGRPARVDEIAGLRPLQRVWTSRQFCDGGIWFASEKEGEGSGDDQACDRSEFAVDFCACTPTGDMDGCFSNTLGKRIEFKPTGCEGPNGLPLPDEERLVRASKIGAGDVSKCPDGTKKDGCLDHQASYNDDGKNVDSPLKPLKKPSAEQTKQLRAIGEALVARHDFWEAPVDREMKRLLGWWQTSFRRPETDLPEIRQALTQELKHSGSMRRVQALILTSLLYSQPVVPPPEPEPKDMPKQLLGAWPPPWTMGPAKYLLAERWLDSVGVAVGEQLGRCDFRFLDDGSATPDHVPTPIVDMVKPTIEGGDFDYGEAAIALGGCTVGARPTTSSIGLTRTEHDLADKLCALGRGVLPDGFGDQHGDKALDAAAERLVKRIFGRETAPGELRQLRDDMNACMDAGKRDAKKGCKDKSAAVRWMCTRLIESAEFAVY